MTASKVFLYLCLLFILGVFIYSFFITPQDNQVSQYYDKQVNIRGIIIKEPEQRINQQKFVIKTGRIDSSATPQNDNKNSHPEQSEGSIIAGIRVLISTELYPQYYYGDQLRIIGKLLEPAVFEDFDYREYLAKDGIHLVSYYSQIKLINQNQGHWFYQRIFNFKDKLRNIIEQTLLPPQSSILKAIFLGDRFGLSNELKEKLNISGTRHITAVSGMHMIIMTQILLFLALGIGLWRKHAFYFVIILLTLYILMIGAPASAVRAGIMAGLLLLAQKLGRLRGSSRAIIFAAVIMLLINPLLIKSDVGFQLSFMACLSIIYLKPILDEKIIKWPNLFHIKDILTMTLAAQLGVLPLLVFHFGQLSLISPVANILIVPFLPIIMISGIFLCFAGLIWLSLANIIAYPVWLILTYILKIVDYLSFPLAVYEFKSFSLFFLILFYLFLVWYVFYKTKN